MKLSTKNEMQAYQISARSRRTNTTLISKNENSNCDRVSYTEFWSKLILGTECFIIMRTLKQNSANAIKYQTNGTNFGSKENVNIAKVKMKNILVFRISDGDGSTAQVSELKQLAQNFSYVLMCLNGEKSWYSTWSQILSK